MRRVAVLAAGVVLASVLLEACGGGTLSPAVQIGRADVNGDGTGGSIEAGDWTYGLPTQGVMWVDRQGTTHDRGLPECLAPGTSTDVKFAAVEVQVGGTTWRPVVWISCQ